MIEIIKGFITIFIDCARVLFSVEIDLTEQLKITFGELLFIFLAIILLVYFIIWALFHKKEG